MSADTGAKIDLRHLAAVETFGGKLIILRRPAEVAGFLHTLD
jgi:hypothetical protein